MKNLCNLIKLNKGGKGGGKGGGKDGDNKDGDNKDGENGSPSLDVEEIIVEGVKEQGEPIIVLEARADLVAANSCPKKLFYDIDNSDDLDDCRAEFVQLQNKGYYIIHGDTVEKCQQNLNDFLKEHDSFIQLGAQPIYMRQYDWNYVSSVVLISIELKKKYGMDKFEARVLATALTTQGVSFAPNNVQKIDMNKIIADLGKGNTDYTTFYTRMQERVNNDLNKIITDVCAINGGLISTTGMIDKVSYDTYEVRPSNDTFTITKKPYGGNYKDYQKYLKKVEKEGIKHAGTITYATKDKLTGEPHAHHIVMRNDPSPYCESAGKSRELLVTYGINPYYAPENLCLAPNNGNLRSIEYADQVYARISTKTSKAEIIEELDKIAIEIQSEEFPKPVDGSAKKTTKGKDPIKHAW